MSSYLLRFTLQGLPATTNSGGRTHWAVKVKEANKWKRAVIAVTAGKRPDYPLEKARISLTRFSSFEPDFDGLVSGFKSVLDGLVEAGIIINDKPSVIGQPNYRWEKTDRNCGRIQVDVESIKD